MAAINRSFYLRAVAHTSSEAISSRIGLVQAVFGAAFSRVSRTAITQDRPSDRKYMNRKAGRLADGACFSIMSPIP